jgi:hypothetical protein
MLINVPKSKAISVVFEVVMVLIMKDIFLCDVTLRILVDSTDYAFLSD